MKKLIILFLFMFFNIVGEKAHTLQEIKEQLEKKEADALKELAYTSGITTNEQYQRYLSVVEQEKNFVFKEIYTHHPDIYGPVQHSPHFPVNKMQEACQHNNLDARNVALKFRHKDYVNKITGEQNSFATTTFLIRFPYINDQEQYQYPDELVHKPIIEVYPRFSSLSPQEQEIVLNHELKHILSLHVFKTSILRRFFEDTYNKSSSDFYALPRCKKYKSHAEQSATIIPTIENAKVAALAVGVCNSSQNRLLSRQDCELLKYIDTLHKEHNNN